MRLVSTRSSTIFCSPEVDEAGCFPVVSPFSFVMLDSDLCEPEEEDGRSSSSGFGCISVNGSSATRSLVGWIGYIVSTLDMSYKKPFGKYFYILEKF